MIKPKTLACPAFSIRKRPETGILQNFMKLGILDNYFSRREGYHPNPAQKAHTKKHTPNTRTTFSIVVLPNSRPFSLQTVLPADRSPCRPFSLQTVVPAVPPSPESYP